jgi:hypothetical protein
MRISVTTPVEQALNHTKAILFDDFRFRMWLGLGFCAFLSTLFSGVGSNLNNLRDPFPSTGGTTTTTPDFDPFAMIGDFIETYPLVIIIAMIVLLPLWALILWLRSRGDFMFLDGVLTNSGSVREPWTTFRYLANSLFRLKLLLFLIGSLLGLPLGLGIFFRVAYPDRLPVEAAVLDPVLIGLGILLILFGLVAALILMLVHDFVIPTMYRRNLLVGDAWTVFSGEIVPGHRFRIVLFYCMKFLLGMAIGLLTILGTCITCCIAALPYVSSVVFLPFLVFMRLYSIYFLEQFGPDWWFFARDGETASEAPPLDDVEPGTGPLTIA